MSKVNFSGWVALLIGTAVWIYGYFFKTGNSSLFDWHANTPWWIADFLPTIESEIGMALVFISIIPMYWPSRPWRKADDTTAVLPSAEIDTTAHEYGQQSPSVHDPQSAEIKVTEIVRELIWDDHDVRQTYEALRARGLSVDDVVTEIARAYVGCQWESRGNFPELWSEALRIIREGRSNFSNWDILMPVAQSRRSDTGLENGNQTVRGKAGEDR